jgi:hypothetical protein
VEPENFQRLKSNSISSESFVPTKMLKRSNSVSKFFGGNKALGAREKKN